MSKKLLINVMHPEEARVAIVEDGRLVELDIEVAGSEQTRGNCYKGIVVRVEPGLQAAFVDIGLKKLGFLQMGELHPDFWQWRDDVPEDQRKRRPRIQEVLRRGQELIVQVEKGERDMKGAALTSYLSLPGRYMVLMPGSDSAGISRKVESEADRKKLKELASQLEIPEGIGYIIRTEALGKTKTDLTKDLKSLLKLNNDILTKAKKSKAPALIYQELDLVIRTIRDYFTAEIDEVLVDSPEVYQQAKDFFKRTMPKSESLVKLHQEKRPIFSRYQLEEQIDQIHEKKVPLKSGGSLVIEPTEALVSIDVNSGKSTGEKGVEDTAFKTNMEAAEEAARQLRLRDLGGLIVIDFIDMRDKKHMSEVEKTLKHALKADKARVTVGRISQFGILEMSRQRIKPTLSEASYLECPHCEGRGKVKSVENMAISFLRKVHAAAAKGTAAEVKGNLPLEVAYYLLNRKKRELAQIENDYEIEVTVKGKPSFLMNQLDLELTKREKPLHAQAAAGEVSMELPAAVPAAAEEQLITSGLTVAEDGKGKKKRRRKKKVKGEGEPVSPVESAVPEHAEDVAEERVAAATVAVAPVEGEQPQAHGEEQKKKKRRRKRKGAKAATEEAVTEVAPETGATVQPEQPAAAAGETPPGTVAAEGAVSVEGAGTAEEHKKKRRRRKRRGAKHAPEEGAAAAAPTEALVAATASPEASPSPLEGEHTDEQKKKRRRRKRPGDKTAAGMEPAAHVAPEAAHSNPPALQAMPADQPAQEQAPVRKTRSKARAVTEPMAEAAGSAPPAPSREPRQRKAKSPVDAPPVAVVTASPEAPATQEKKPRRSRTAANPVGSAEQPEAPVEAPALPPKKPVRKKKQEPAGQAGGE